MVTFIDGLTFGEGPRWHGGQLYLSDMHAHRVVRAGADGSLTTVLEHSGPVSGLGWDRDGRLLVVAMEGLVLRLDGDRVRVHADLRPLARHEVNDMISHPGGWSYVGQFGYDREAGGRPVPSALLRVGADGRVDEAAEGLMVANGMALTGDGATLLVAESAAGRISSFAVGDDGALGERVTWARLPEGHVPDGMCIDAGGGAWVAAVLGGAFIRVLRGGEVTDRIPVEDGRHAVACVLGGPDRRTLYGLTATTLGQAEESRAARSGRVEAHPVEIPGAGRP